MTSIMATLVFFIVLGILILIHEFGHFIFAKRAGVRVERFSIGFGPRLLSLRRNETEYVISLLPLGGYVKLAGESSEDNPKGLPWEFLSKPVGVRAKIILAGPLLNYLLGFVLFSFIFTVGYPTLLPEVGDFLEGYPAATSGLKKGDRIIAVDDTAIRSWDELVALIQKKTAGSISLNVKRGEKVFDLSVAPKVIEKKDLFGNMQTIALLGIAPSGETVRVKYSLPQAVFLGAKRICVLTGMTLKALLSLVTGRMSVKQAVTGPIGIFIITERAAQMGLIYLLQVMAILSTSLAIFNVLPIPVLDGGHLFFLVIEKIRRRPLSVKVQAVITHIGLSFLILIMIFVFYTDIVRWGIVDKVVGIFK